MKDTIRYKDYVDEVKNLFRKSNTLSDEIIDEYFEGEEVFNENLIFMVWNDLP